MSFTQNQNNVKSALSRGGALTGGLAFTIAVVSYLICTLLAFLLIGAAGLGGTEAARYISFLVSPLSVTVTAGIIFGYCKLPVKTALPLKCKPRYYLIALALIFGMLFSLGFLNDLLIKGLESLGYKSAGVQLPSVEGGRVVAVVLVVAVLPALAEEILFRGIIFNCAKTECGSVGAVLLSGLCFCIYHGSVEQTIYQFLCGCAFALLALRSGSIAPGTVIHFINNALIIILFACGCTDADGNVVMPFAATVTVTVLSAICLIGAVVCLILDKSGNRKRLSGGIKTFFVYASVGMAAMLVIWVVNLF